MPHKDKQKDKEYKARWQKEHAKAHLESSRRWAKRNPEKERQRKIEWLKKNPIKRMLQVARGSAKKKGLEFSIDATDIIIPNKCPILGILLQKGHHKQTYRSPSLDRIDNTKGYIKGNVWVISWRANRLKCDASLEELEKMVIALRRKLRTKPKRKLMV